MDTFETYQCTAPLRIVSTSKIFSCLVFLCIRVSPLGFAPGFITFILKDEYRLSLEMLMHVKCIHDLCTLPLDIPPYLHHILVIFMLFDDYWK
jgi:hypothetical protein